MRHVSALILMLRIIGGIIILVGALKLFHSAAALGAMKSAGTAITAGSCIGIFLPGIICALAGIGCIVLAGIISRKN